MTRLAATRQARASFARHRNQARFYAEIQAIRDCRIIDYIDHSRKSDHAAIL